MILYVEIAPKRFWTLLDVILEVDCVQLHILSGINCHPLRLCLTFGRNPKMVRVKIGGKTNDQIG